MIFVPFALVIVGVLLGRLWLGARADRVPVRTCLRTGARLSRGHAPRGPVERAVARSVLAREESVPQGPWMRWGLPALFLCGALLYVPDRNWALAVLMLGNTVLFTAIGLLAPRRAAWCAWLRRELRGGDGSAAAGQPGGGITEPG
ncbi:hypothetical protein [Streptomyces sp. SID11385]|uniref:hypothetical protein n=1 Tax=Streptomyces sp. SID11385 TaxID=2706031 RepID=UPI0013C669ED|nr:hypothetical protein [Streptomyces sp. SID11385]NEA42887.1 hypothetical protein [Streptomyces sp. SID11385]